MNQIEKLVTFIEEGFRHAPSERFELRDNSDMPVLLDKVNRIRVSLYPTEIHLIGYDVDTGGKKNEVVVPWNSLSVRQRQRIVELVDTPDDLDPDIENGLLEMLKGV